ncbi:MAG: acetyl esterase/lipase [Saprospiraceae bacterium]|jgi:acetyl esterase/lipase
MKYFNLLFFLLFIAVISCAQGDLKLERTFIPRDLLMQNADIFQVKLSMDGTRVYYRRTGGSDTLYYREPEVSTLEKYIVFPENIKSYALTYNKGIVATAQTKESAKVFFAQGSSVKDVTPFKAKSVKILAFSRRLNSRVAMKFESDSIAQKGVWLVDMAGQKPRKIGLLGDMDMWYFDGLFHVKAGTKENDIGGISLYRKSNGIWEPISENAPDVGRYIGGYQKIVSVSEDGSNIYYTDNSASDKAILKSIGTDTGKEETLAKDELTDLLAMTALVNAEGKPQMILGSYADARRSYLDKATEMDMIWLEKEMRGSPSVSQQSEDGNIWIVKELTGGPIGYYLFNRKDQKITRLFSDNEALSTYEMAERTRFTVRTRDAMQLPVHLYIPADSDGDGDGYPDNPLPTILFVHGDPWKGVMHWNNWSLTRNFQLLADRGYAVLNVEFRGSGGLGKAFTDAGNKQWGGKMRLDLIDISRWAQKEGIAQEDKVGIWGYSYGGYAANAGATLSSGEYACHISMVGLSDLSKYMENKGGSGIWTERVADPDTQEGKAILKKASPINYVDEVRAPILLVTGGQDARVPAEEQSAKFANALAEADKDVLYLDYPEEGHKFAQQGTWVSFWAIAEQFLAKSLGGEFAPINEDLDKGFYDVLVGEDFVDGLE